MERRKLNRDLGDQEKGEEILNTLEKRQIGT